VARRSSYRRGLGYAGLSTIALAAVGVVSSVAIARAYGVEALGAYTLVIAPGLALTFLSTAKEQTALVRELSTLHPRDPRVSGLFYATFAFSITLTTAVSALTFAVAYLVFHGPVGQPDLLPLVAADLAAQVVLVNTCFNLDSVLMAFRAGGELLWARLGQAIAFPAVAVGLSFVSDSVWWLVAAGAASWAIALAARMFSMRHFMRIRVSAEELREGFRALPDLIRFGIRLAPGGIAAGASSQLGVWVLGAVGSVAQVGAYGRSWMLSSRLLIANTRIGEMLLPTLVERREQQDFAGFDRALGDSMRYALAALLLPAAVAGGAAAGVMEVFGPGFHAAAGALSVLLLLPALAAIQGIQGQTLLAAVGMPGTSAWISVARAAITLVLTIPLTIWLGATGTALGLVIGAVLVLPVTMRLARRHVSAPLSRWCGPRDLFAVGAAYAGGFIAAHAVDRALDGIPATALALLAGAAGYALAFVLAGGIRDRDRERLRDVLANATRRRRLSSVGAR